MSCPACDPDAISGGATDWLDQHAYYTNWGPGLDLVAPGGELYSNTTAEAGIWSAVPGGYAYYQGTSMSAPHVTGIAGIVASVRGLRGAGLRSRLEGTTDDLGASGYDEEFGHGRVNAMRAVEGSVSEPPPEEPPTETVTASIAYSCSKADCLFDGSGSTGANLAYEWRDGGGAVLSSAVSFRHGFEGPGDHTVQLTVSNADDTDTASVIVSCTPRGPNLHCR